MQNPTQLLQAFASQISGGQDLSSYPGKCVLSIERRTVPGETAAQVENKVTELVERVRQKNGNFRATLRRGIDRVPLETPQDSEIVQVVKVSTSALGSPCAITGVAYWTDAATLWAAGIPTVLFGPTGAGAHSVEERVDLASVERCAEKYLESAINFCG